MVTLNNAYQYIGRTNGVGCDGGWSYYVLLYARIVESTTTGKHTVGVKMRLACEVDSSFYAYNTTGSAKIGGITAISWNTQQVPNSTWSRTAITEDGKTYPRWIDLKEGTAVIDTGFVEKEVTIEASWERNSIDWSRPSYLPFYNTITASINVKLPLIASASTITEASDTTLGNHCNVEWTPQAASFSYKLKFAIGDWSHTTDAIHPNKTTAFAYKDYAIPIDVASEVSKKTGTMTVTLYSYSDSDATKQIGSADTEEFTVTVPETEATKPTVSMSLSPESTLADPFDSYYLQGKSKLKVDLVVDTKYGADVDSSSITVDGTHYESTYLTKPGEVLVKATVKDSRGHSGTAEQSITVIPYSKPIVQAASGESNIVATRCDANGNVKDSGTYLKIKAKLIYEKVMVDDLQHNGGNIQYRYRSEGDLWSDWYTIYNYSDSSSVDITTDALLDGKLDIKTNYQVQVKAIDEIEESLPITLSVPSDDVYMDRPAGGKGMGLGGYNSGPGNLDVYWKTKARGGLSLFNEEGEEISADETLPLPRGVVGEGWNPDHIANGIHWVSTYPLKDAMGNAIMENGILIQMVATIDGSMKIQMAFPTDTHTPAYRIFQEGVWTPWYTWNISMI